MKNQQNIMMWALGVLAFLAMASCSNVKVRTIKVVQNGALMSVLDDTRIEYKKDDTVCIRYTGGYNNISYEIMNDGTLEDTIITGRRPDSSLYMIDHKIAVIQ